MKKTIAKIIKKLDIKTIFGLLLMIFILGLNSYFNPEIVKIENTSVITGILVSKPIFTANNGDNVENIKFELKGYSRSFIVKGCALLMINNYDLMKLESGAKLEIRASTDDLNKEKSFLSGSTKVLGIKTSTEEILSLKNLNYCNKDKWKDFRNLGVIFLILFLLFGYWGYKSSE